MYIVIEIETIIAGSKSIACRSEGVNIKPGEGLSAQAESEGERESFKT